MRHAGSFAVTMLLATLPLYACAGETALETDSGLPPPTEDAGTTTAQPSTAAEVRTNARDGFVAEAQWTHSYGIAALSDGPDVPAAFSRLNQTEAQIALGVAPFAGDASASQLADLLHARANELANLVTSISSTSVSTSIDPQAALDANADQIGAYFATLCPNAFPGNGGDFLKAADRSMAAALSATTRDPAQAIIDFDAAQVSSVRFADVVGNALASTFSTTLAPPTTSRIEDSLALELHLLFGDQVFWTRAYVIDHMKDVATQPELDRAVRATDDMAEIFISYFGQDTGPQIQAYAHADTTNAVAFLLAIEANDQTTMDVISAQWSAGARTFAQYLAANVGVDQAAAEKLLDTSVDRERAMIEARANQQWDAEATNYQLVLESRTEFASLLAASITTRPRPVH
jgi:hypothetical protein